MFEAHKAQILAAAVEAGEHEMCGVIHAGQFIRLQNVASDPRNAFAFADADTARYMTDPATEAVVHSHPSADPEEEGGKRQSRLSPSAVDMRQQLATTLPWVIAAQNVDTGTWEVFDWGKHTLDLPILERPFRHGVEDCYTVIQKWHWQNRGVLLLPMPRDESWWGNVQKGEPPKADLYVNHFKDCGAERFWPRTPRDLKPGDVFLFKLGTGSQGVYNHGGVFLGDGLVAHHAPSKLSSDGPIGPWFSRIDFWLRREGGA